MCQMDRVAAFFKNTVQIALGYVASKIDPCLFLTETVRRAELWISRDDSDI